MVITILVYLFLVGAVSFYMIYFSFVAAIQYGCTKWQTARQGDTTGVCWLWSLISQYPLGHFMLQLREKNSAAITANFI